MFGYMFGDWQVAVCTYQGSHMNRRTHMQPRTTAFTRMRKSHMLHVCHVLVRLVLVHGALPREST